MGNFFHDESSAQPPPQIFAVSEVAEVTQCNCRYAGVVRLHSTTVRSGNLNHDCGWNSSQSRNDGTESDRGAFR